MTLLVLALATGQAAAEDRSSPDRVLRGVLTRADHQTYREVPFDVPKGVGRLTVTFAYTGKAEGATVDLGVVDPQGFRGWSGGNKSGFTLSAWDATPSYRPGPIPAGRWKLLLGVPNIRPNGRSTFTAEVRFGRGDAPPGPAPLRRGPAWYRGDLHLHSAHSDGSCAAQSGANVPCPVFKTLEAAAAQGLDFVVLSDHNTRAQDQSLRDLQPYFDRLLLIAGEEVTTFHGHLGAVGADGFIDFRVGDKAGAINRVLGDVRAAHGLSVINHPALPTSEACLGCGWSAEGTDFARVDAVEVVNGGALGFQGGLADGPLSGIPFWERRLGVGDHVTAVGGSDNHRPDTSADRPSAVGVPTTVVWAADLSQAAILEGLRAGHVFIDVEGRQGRRIDLTSGEARMGDSRLASPGPMPFTARAVGVAGGVWRVIEDAAAIDAITPKTIASQDQSATFTILADARPHWVRLEVRSADGRRTLLIGNPIFLAPTGP